MKRVSIDEIQSLDMVLAVYPESFINKHKQDLDVLYGSQKNFESKIAQYMDNIAKLNYFNHVRQINCLSTHVSNMNFAINDLLRNCEHIPDDLLFAKDLNNYLTEYITNWTMLIVSDAWHDNFYQKNDSQTVTDQYKRIVETATSLNQNLLQTDVNPDTRKLIQSHLNEFKNIQPDPQSVNNPQISKPVQPIAAANKESKSSSGCIWGIIFLILIAIRIGIALSN